MKQRPDLLEAFEAVSDEQWQNAIARFLKGQPLSDLDWEVAEGVTISPLQRHATTSPVDTGWRSALGGNQWRLTEAVVVHNNAELPQANTQLLHALNQGADALHIQWHYCPSPQDLEQLFQGVLLDLITIQFDASRLEAAEFIPALTQWSGIKEAQGGSDYQGSHWINPSEFWPLAERHTTIDNWRWLTFKINPAEEQSMAQALYQASLWIDFLLEKEYSLTQIVQWMRFEYAIDPRYFVALGQIRAFKRCWLALMKGYQSEVVWPWLHAHTVNDAQADQYRNMLVGTTQAMSAVIAGVDSLWVQPANGWEEANDFTRRIARNVQHLLQAESYLNRVIDPAAGAYYIEQLTKKLTEQAWQQFCAL